MFPVSLAAAIALSPQGLFFLVVVTPVVAVLFALLDGWSCRRTNAPLVGAMATSPPLAWAISSTFLLVR